MTNKVRTISNKPSLRGSRYPEELKRQALELFRESMPEYKTKKTTAKRVSELLGIRSFDTVLAWVKQSDIDCGKRPGVTTETAKELIPNW